MTFLLATARVLYVVGTALAFGGTAALSFAAAPATFRGLKPADAGRVFGRTLAAFDRMAFWACAVATVAAAAEAALGAGPAAAIRAVLAGCVTALLGLTRRALAPAMAALKPPESDDAWRTWEPEKRAAFDRLHAQYVRIYSANLFLSLAGLVLAGIG